MNAQEYDDCVDELTRDRTKVAEGKREDYTRGDEDVLANFKNQGEYFGVDPKISLGVHMEKQFSAVCNYIKTGGKSESEPIIKRIGDTINYLELLWGLINEEYTNKVTVPDDVDVEKLKEEWKKIGKLVPKKDIYPDLKEYYPETPDKAFRPPIDYIGRGGSFELQEDIDGLGDKGDIIDSPNPVFEWIKDKELKSTNLHYDSRFTRCE